MSIQRPLKFGVAYHGNRFLSHAMDDMRKIAAADMDIVVHMFSHNDWERHDTVMGDMFKLTESMGLEVWVDNWGIGGAPGEKCHFLGAHPEAHTLYGNGLLHPYQICLNAPAYREFVKAWVDKVASLGGKTVFWDEPFIPDMKTPDGQGYYSACTCPVCRKKFEEKYGKPMPEIMDADVSAFRNDTIIDFHNFITEYANKAGMKSVICFMPYQLAGMKQQTATEKLLNFDIDAVCAMPYVDNIGTDPYWYSDHHPYEYVYNATKICVDKANKYGKDHNIWIQTYANKLGHEEEIVTAYQAAYDAGARTIINWSFMGGEPNSYRSDSTERTWCKTCEAVRRVRDMERDKLLAEYRARYMK